MIEVKFALTSRQILTEIPSGGNAMSGRDISIFIPGVSTALYSRKARSVQYSGRVV